MSFSAALLIALCVAILGNILLLGLPGAFFLSFASYIIKPLNCEGIDELGDKAWPMAVVTTFLWGIGLIFCRLIIHKWPFWQPYGIWVLWLGWGVLLSFCLLICNHFISQKEN